jgi:hypothetical protein
MRTPFLGVREQWKPAVLAAHRSARSQASLGRFQASRLGDGLLVEGSSEAGRQVEMLIAKRDGILEWPEGSGRETALQAIEDVIIEVARSGPLPLRVSGRPI